MKLPFQKSNVASDNFQILEDLATGSWYSEVLFAAMELGIFDALSDSPCSGKELANRLECEMDGLSRFLEALTALGLIVSFADQYENGPLASRYLTKTSAEYAGHFFSYRRFLADHWKRLSSRIRNGIPANNRSVDESPAAYSQRVLAYVQAMDFQACIKASEAAELLPLFLNIQPGRIIDIGGGAGAWCRALIGRWPEAHASLLDLPETLKAARKLYPDATSWNRIDAVAGDCRNSCFQQDAFDIAVLSNILHAYGAEEAERLVVDAVRMLAPGGLLLIHDYFMDGHRTSPLKSKLYDLHMLLNTYNGRIYGLNELQPMLEAAGLHNHQLLHLKTDTSILISIKDESRSQSLLPGRDMMEARARLLGFDFAAILRTNEIALEPWVKLKCEFGCARFGKSRTCPPFSPPPEKMQKIVSSYTHALIVQSTPPSKQFHQRLLDLEKLFLLHGYQEALAFGSGPCTACPSCPLDGDCRHPEFARPSMESCGVDVYETAQRAGLCLEPVRCASDYVRYIGMVLFKNREESCAFF